MKAVAWLVGLVVLAVIGAGVYVLLNSGGLLKSGIEEFGPDYLGAPVSVAGVDVSFTDGSATVSQLRIGNPDGFAGPTSIAVGEMSAVLDIEQTTETLVVMKRLVIDSAELVAIAQGDKTNLQKLMDNLDAATADDGGAAAAESADSEEIKYIVEQFDFTNAKASLTSDVLGELDISVPDIRLTDLGRASNGATAAQLVKQIMRPISKSVSREAVKQGLDVDGLKADVKQKVKDKIGSGLRNLLNK